MPLEIKSDDEPPPPPSHSDARSVIDAAVTETTTIIRPAAAPPLPPTPLSSTSLVAPIEMHKPAAFMAPLRPTSCSPRAVAPLPMQPILSSAAQPYVAKPPTIPGTMASIIRSTPHIQPVATAHVAPASLVAATYSSHVPRGPAAVASITPPRAAVATPMVRPSTHPHLSCSGPQPVVCRILSAPQPIVTSKAVPSVLAQNMAPTDVHRPPLPSSMATIQVAASSSSAVGHPEQVLRPVSKPVHISTPIMQGMHQILSQSHAPPSLTPQLQGANMVPHTTMGPTKLLSQAMHTVAPLSIQPPTVPRQNSATPIPVAKVHPQPLPVVSRASVVEPVETVNLLLPPTHLASQSQPPAGNNVTAAMPAGVVLMEAKQERTSGPQTGPYTLSTAYYYEPYKSNLPMPYVAPTSSFPTISTTRRLTMTHASEVQAHPVGSMAAKEANGVVVSAADLHPVSTSVVSSSVSTYSLSQPSVTSTTSSSPRPSILRKRMNEGLLESPKPNRMESQSAEALVRVAESKLPTDVAKALTYSENGNGTVSSSSSSSTGGLVAASVTIKQEPPEVGETVTVCPQPSSVSIMETSPRKKPRKQQLTSNELMETHSTDAEDEFEKESKERVKKELIVREEDGVCWVPTRKRPPITLLNSYRHTWKSRHNHFLRYSDVRPKERHPTVHDLANQKGVLQKVSGWKVHHLCTQLDEMVEQEDNVHGRLADFLKKMEDAMSQSDEDRDLNKVSELIKGNLQRCRITRDQMKEARQQILKVTDHKPQVTDIISKFMSKRGPGKRRDKNN